MGTDEAHREHDTLQKATDRYVTAIDAAGAHKEQEVLEV